MTTKTFLLITGLLLAPVVTAGAQEKETFEQFNAKRQKRFDKFREQRRKEFEVFRRKRNEEFAKFLRKEWTPVDPTPVLEAPKDEPRPPVVKPEDEQPPVAPAPEPVPIEEVVPLPVPKPQPQPIDPIEEVPVSPVKAVPTHDFTFLNTGGQVRLEPKKVFQLSGLSENAVADAWLKLSEESYTNLIYDCLQLRKMFHLCDWAYLQMLHEMAGSICGEGTNEATLLMAYVYCQSGYKMRLAYDDKTLYMMFASDHEIFDWDHYLMDGERYYPYGNKQIGQLVICPQQYPKEQSLSLLINQEPMLAMTPTEPTVHKTGYVRKVEVSFTANRNMLDFYSTYPTSKVGDNVVSRWAMYANMPMPQHVSDQIYPQLRQAIEGLDSVAAVNCLLNWVQKAFQYEFDYTVWGCDRAFFPEETLHYPYCDCEDRSILFTRIVRDLLGLDCILVFYPGHLASAVRLGGEVPGDYILLDGERYTIADPTYIGASLGMTMPDMNNASAQVILLQ